MNAIFTHIHNSKRIKKNLEKSIDIKGNRKTNEQGRNKKGKKSRLKLFTKERKGERS